ncbi:signal peptide protein [Acinetobacter oleivorans]|uniref:Signal peptide protein n=1 Tax=Acinetobacter oleivorans TaxID=1148157 RepID=A0A0B2UDG5_9GAMM|nr:signal peptide protein [Acinetobacter oleivorans]
MNKFLILSLALACSYSFAHEPYVAPLAYKTEQTQVPVIAGYAEEALNSEYALKDAKLTVITPKNELKTVKPEALHKSVTVFDVDLPDEGTYILQTQASYPLSYVYDQKTWHLFFDMPADKAPPKAEREYLIPADLKTKTIKTEQVTREWTLQSYLSKGKVSDIQLSNTPIKVNFSVHPNLIKAAQSIKLTITEKGQPLAYAEVNLREKGATDKQAQPFKADNKGQVELKFPKAGEYLLEVTAPVDLKLKPKNQNYTIVSLNVLAQ